MACRTGRSRSTQRCSRRQSEPRGELAQQASAQVESDNDAAKARAGYKPALRERDDKIAEAAESAKRPRAEIDELRRAGEEQRVSF